MLVPESHSVALSRWNLSYRLRCYNVFRERYDYYRLADGAYALPLQVDAVTVRRAKCVSVG
jgi:hypothetical protein